MIDPKYAHLPGIDAGQPDVFETSDLPESDQPDPTPASANASTDQAGGDAADQVETLKVDVKDVYGRFKDKRVDASKVDFSDNVGASTRSGYDNAVELQINMDRSNETLEMRFKRLQVRGGIWVLFSLCICFSVTFVRMSFYFHASCLYVSLSVCHLI